MRLFNCVVIFGIVLVRCIAAYGTSDLDFGGRWVKSTLNFCYEEKNLKTGRDGNVKEIDNEKFDVDSIHDELKKNHEQAVKTVGTHHNLVIAGLTLLVKFGDNYECIYTPFRERKTILGFVSGSTDQKYNKQGYTFIGPSEQYAPDTLFQRFSERITRSKTACTHLAHDKVTEYYKQWESKQQQVLMALKEATRNILENSHDSFKTAYSFKNQLDNAIKIKVEESNKHVGSAVDSEQFLISYLTQNSEKPLGQNSPNFLMHYNTLLGDYKTKKLENLKRGFNVTLSESISLDNLDKVQASRANVSTKVQSDIETFKDVKEIGCIFHIHSTNEICCCCAYSLVTEIYKTIGDELKKTMEIHNQDSHMKPFMLLLCSASSKLKLTTDNRPGIGELYHEDISDDGKNPKIDSLVNQGLFLQRLI